MKVGILTFHYGSNYGGVLQCYALQQVLKSMGHDSFVVNYVPKDSFKKFVFVVLEFLQKRNRQSLNALWHYVFYHRSSRKVFLEFRNRYLSMTSESVDVNSFKDIDCDAIVVGSDQVWNYSQQKRSVYFLGWLKNPKVRKLSYAACCGSNKVDEQYRSQLVEQLSVFSAISVRSSETQHFIKDVMDKEVPVVADPTFLYDFKEFIRPNNKKYILTYILTDDIEGGNASAIKEIKKHYPGIPVYSIVISDRQPRLCPWADKQLFDVSPDEWVNLINNCTFLYTDSFHGAVFAMKYGKPFIAYYSNEASGRRIIDLQHTFSLSNVAKTIDDIKKIMSEGTTETPDFTEKIEKLKTDAFSYLRESL